MMDLRTQSGQVIADNFVRKATIVNVVDGDTFDARVDLGFDVSITERFNLSRVSTFGIRRVSTTVTEDHLKLGFEAKSFVRQKLRNKEVLIHSVKRDGFRRWLAEVYYEENGQLVSLADELIKNGLTTTDTE